MDDSFSLVARMEPYLFTKYQRYHRMVVFILLRQMVKPWKPLMMLKN